MGMSCAVCGKIPVRGNHMERRGKAKYLGGIGRKTTGITKRFFKPNLQRIQIEKEGTVMRVRVCVQCIRSGAVKRPQKSKPFSVPKV